MLSIEDVLPAINEMNEKNGKCMQRGIYLKSSLAVEAPVKRRTVHVSKFVRCLRFFSNFINTLYS